MNKATAILFFLLLSCALSGQKADLINGDFEDTPAGSYIWEDISGWRVQAFAGAQAAFNIVDDQSASGQQSLQVDVQVPVSINTVYVCNHYTSPVAVSKGDRLIFSFSIKSGFPGGLVQARIISSDNTNTLTKEFFEVPDTFSVFELASDIYFEDSFGIRLDFGSAAGLFWLDNVQARIQKPVIDTARVYVSAEEGSDSNPGTFESPLKTIGKAMENLKAGGSCVIRKGIYGEELSGINSGLEGLPVTIRSYAGEKVIISGADRVNSHWEPWEEDPRIWRTPLTGPVFTQLFLKGASMSPARWPNMEYHENWITHKKWGYTGPGTTFGFISSDSLASLNTDLTGAKAFLRIGKGNSCYSRDILEHGQGSATFRWDTTQFIGTQFTGENGDPVKMANNGLANNEFFIIGKLGLLDTPGEWFYDSIHQWLYFYPPGGEDPTEWTFDTRYGITVLSSMVRLISDWKIFPSMLVISTLATLTI